LRGIVGVTGSPGTGKKSISPLVAAALGLKCLAINDLARKCGALGRGGSEVDVELLRDRIGREVTGPALLFGHLIPYVLDPRSARKVVILRCDPGVLKTRLARRGYSARKLRENVEAELIGVVSADAYSAFGPNCFEFDTTRTTPGGAAERVVRLLQKARPAPRVDWTLGYDSAKLRSLLSAASSPLT